ADPALALPGPERDRERRSQQGGTHVAMAVGVGVAGVVLPGATLGSDAFEDAVQVGAAAGLVLDRRHAAGRVGDEHGAEPVGEAGVVDGLLCVGGDVEHVAVALRVEGEFLVPCLHAAPSLPAPLPATRLCRVSLRVDLWAITSAVAVSAGERMSSPPRQASLPQVPEPLLVPLLDAAGEMLRALDPIEVPPILRPVAQFDRRGLARGAARQQLMGAIENEGVFRERAVERFTSRLDVSEVLEAWDPGDAVDVVGDAAER